MLPKGSKCEPPSPFSGAVGRPGLEPGTCGLKVRRAANCASGPGCPPLDARGGEIRASGYWVRLFHWPNSPLRRESPMSRMSHRLILASSTPVAAPMRLGVVTSWGTNGAGARGCTMLDHEKTRVHEGAAGHGVN